MDKGCPAEFSLFCLFSACPSTLFSKASSYSCPPFFIDGMNLLDVHFTAAFWFFREKPVMCVIAQASRTALHRTDDVLCSKISFCFVHRPFSSPFPVGFHLRQHLTDHMVTRVPEHLVKTHPPSLEFINDGGSW